MKACASATFLASFGMAKLVEPHLRASLRDRVADLDAAVGLGGALLRLLHVAGPADDQADLARGERVEIFRRVELADVRPDLNQQLGGLVEIGLRRGVRIEAEIMQRRRHDVVGESSMCTPQSLNLASSPGLNTTSQEHCGIATSCRPAAFSASRTFLVL